MTVGIATPFSAFRYGLWRPSEESLVLRLYRGVGLCAYSGPCALAPCRSTFSRAPFLGGAPLGVLTRSRAFLHPAGCSTAVSCRPRGARAQRCPRLDMHVLRGTPVASRAWAMAARLHDRFAGGLRVSSTCRPAVRERRTVGNRFIGFAEWLAGCIRTPGFGEGLLALLPQTGSRRREVRENLRLPKPPFYSRNTFVPSEIEGIS